MIAAPADTVKLSPADADSTAASTMSPITAEILPSIKSGLWAVMRTPAPVAVALATVSGPLLSRQMPPTPPVASSDVTAVSIGSAGVPMLPSASTVSAPVTRSAPIGFASISGATGIQHQVGDAGGVDGLADGDVAHVVVADGQQSGRDAIELGDAQRVPRVPPQIDGGARDKRPKVYALCTGVDGSGEVDVGGLDNHEAARDRGRGGLLVHADAVHVVVGTDLEGTAGRRDRGCST